MGDKRKTDGQAADAPPLAVAPGGAQRVAADALPWPDREAILAGLKTGASMTGAAPLAERSLEQALGAEIRKLRRRADLTVADLSASAGISAGMLSKIENGQISPSLASLQAVASALHVPLTQLFAAFEERRDSSFVPAGQGVRIERRGSKVGHQYQLLGHALGGAIGVEPYLITLEEDAATYSGFQHAGTEFIYMLSGEVEYRHGDRLFHLRPGDALMFDSAAPHGPERFIRSPMTYLSILVFAREAGAPE